MRKWGSMILAILMIISLASGYLMPASATDNDRELTKEYGQYSHYDLDSDLKVKGVKNKNSKGLMQMKGTAAKSSYSAVDDGLVTPVKSQGYSSSCWAFSAVSVCETSLIKKGAVINGTTVTKDNLDLSEAHLVYTFYHSTGDRYGNTEGDKTETLVDGGPNAFVTSTGGNSWFTRNALSNYGLALDSAYPFDLTTLQTIGTQDAYKRVAYLDRAIPISSDDTSEYSHEAAFKQAISTYGSITIGYVDADECYSYDANNQALCYYDPPDHIDSTSAGGHAVTIVGWDDDFSKDNFTSTVGKPSSDGAWLVKNS